MLSLLVTVGPKTENDSVISARDSGSQKQRTIVLSLLVTVGPKTENDSVISARDSGSKNRER